MASSKTRLAEKRRLRRGRRLQARRREQLARKLGLPATVPIQGPAPDLPPLGEALLQVCQPFRAVMDPQALETASAAQALITLTAAAWNTARLPPAQAEDLRSRIIRHQGSRSPEYQRHLGEIFATLRARSLDLFPDDPRLVLHTTVEVQRGRLRVEATGARPEEDSKNSENSKNSALVDHVPRG